LSWCFGNAHTPGTDLASTVSEAVWTTITLIDGIWVDDQVRDDQLPGWRLMEVDRQTGELTGREVAALHESLREVDPEGVDGAPLF